MTGLHHALVELCGLALWPTQVLPDVTGATVFRYAVVQRVVDGDTLDVWLIRKQDRGVFAAGMCRVRLAHIDTPELRSSDPLERAAAAAARDRVQELARPGQLATVYEYGIDKYGRTLASIEVTGVDIGQALLAEGLARPYEGGTK